MQRIAGVKSKIDLDLEEVFMLPNGRYRNMTLEEMQLSQGMRAAFPHYEHDFLKNK